MSFTAKVAALRAFFTVPDDVPLPRHGATPCRDLRPGVRVRDSFGCGVVVRDRTGRSVQLRDPLRPPFSVLLMGEHICTSTWPGRWRERAGAPHLSATGSLRMHAAAGRLGLCAPGACTILSGFGFGRIPLSSTCCVVGVNLFTIYLLFTICFRYLVGMLVGHLPQP